MMKMKPMSHYHAKISQVPTVCITGISTVEVNASDFTMGGIISQHQKDDTWQPVTFISKSFNSAEWKYEIYNKEF